MSYGSVALSVVVALALAGCGDDGESASLSVASATSTTTSASVPDTTGAPSTTAAPRTTVPPRATTTVTAAPTTRATTPATTTTVPAGRTVALGTAFSLRVGETVTVAGEGLVLTFVTVVSDSRCPVGVQCIQAGNALITVTAQAGASPAASLSLNTFDPPLSAAYGRYTVELVQLGRSSPAVARLRVT